MLVFMLARRLGAPVFQESVSASARQRYDGLLQSHAVLLWAAYSVPVLPVDMLSVLAGLSRISAKRFLTIALTAYVVYSGIVAFVGDVATSLLGASETLALLGCALLAAVIRWVWRTSRPADQRAAPGSSIDGPARS